jgi:hypothetical protein
MLSSSSAVTRKFRMYTDGFDSEKAKQRIRAVIRKQNAAAARSTYSRLRRLLPHLRAAKAMTPLQECLAVHMYCSKPHSALE